MAALPQQPALAPAAAAADRRERIFQALLTGALAALGFFLPFSTAGTSLALFALLLLCLAAPRRLLELQPWREPVLACGLLLLAWILLRTLAEGGPWRSGAATVNRYHELLMMPLLWALLRLAWRPQALIGGLVAGSLALALALWLQPVVAALADFLHYRRISAGFVLSACAFLLLELGRARALPRAPALAVAAFLATTVLLANDSRTGHLVLLLLATCSALRATPRRWRLLGALALLAIALAVAALAGPVRSRLVETWQDAQAKLAGSTAITSTGARLELAASGLAVARQHWLLGTGWRQYPQAFRAASQQRHGDAVDDIRGAQSDNPHSEYLMQLGAGGLPALVLWLAWLGWPMARCLRPGAGPQPWTTLAGGLALGFAVGSLFNSQLLDFIEGHAYGAMLAWLLACRTQEQRAVA